MLVEVHVDFEDKSLVVFDVEGERVFSAPGAVLSHMQVIKDAGGAIVRGQLIETVGRSFRPAEKKRFKIARWTRKGEVIDADTFSMVDSSLAAVIKPSLIYYFGE